MHYLGLDIGGTFIKAGLVDETGRILESRKAPTSVDDLSGFLSQLTELIRGFQKTTAIDAVGIGVPGLRSNRTHTIETSPNIPCLKHVNLEQLVADLVHIRVVSENDANAAAYGEFVCGAAAGLQHMAHLTLGTGLGSGFILNGRLFTGASGYGGEFGHTLLIVTPEGRTDTGRLCGCGKPGCVEMYVSAAAIIMNAQGTMAQHPDSSLHKLEPPLTSQKIYEAALRGDTAAQGAIGLTARHLGVACANLINLLNLEMIVIGGGVMAAGELIMKPAIEAAKYHAFPASYADCQIVQSKLWPDAGLIGAAMLARDR